MRPDDLLVRLEDRPFKPFRIHLSDGTQIEVAQPGMVIVGTATAVLPTRFADSEEGRRIVRDRRTIALRYIVQFSDLAETNGENGQNSKP